MFLDLLRRSVVLELVLEVFLVGPDVHDPVGIGGDGLRDRSSLLGPTDRTVIKDGVEVADVSFGVSIVLEGVGDVVATVETA